MSSPSSAEFESIYENRFTPVFRYIFLRVRDKAEAEDLAQTVFLKVYQAYPSSSQLQDLPLAYFFTVARNTVIDHWRKKKDVLPEDPDSVFENIPDHETPDKHALRSENGQELLRAMDEVLSDLEREALVLRFMNQLSTKEVAEVMDKSEVAVRQLQSRGLKSLRKHVNKK